MFFLGDQVFAAQYVAEPDAATYDVARFTLSASGAVGGWGGLSDGMESTNGQCVTVKGDLVYALAASGASFPESGDDIANSGGLRIFRLSTGESISIENDGFHFLTSVAADPNRDILYIGNSGTGTVDVNTLCE
jgi:hypothetical protein